VVTDAIDGGVPSVPRSRSKRSNYTPPKPARPKPSPKWVPYVGVGLIVAGVLLVIAAYVLPIPGGNFNLLIGFAMMAGGLIALSQWR
jgi:hypothetical protein